MMAVLRASVRAQFAVAGIGSNHDTLSGSTRGHCPVTDFIEVKQHQKETNKQVSA